MEQNTIEQKIQEFVAKIEAKNPNEPEFLQAVLVLLALGMR
jgi:glutamate dehydrogenase (NADP+)